MMLVKTLLRESIRRVTPWWAKTALKLAFVKVPLPYNVLRRAALARHGGMEKPGWAFDAFHRHFDHVDFHRKGSGGFSVLELGPGDSLFSALIARARGAASTTLVDVGYFANTELGLYREMADFLRAKGLDAPDLSSAKTIDDVLAACNARYETGGLGALRKLPECGFDFIFSNGTLQAVLRSEVPETLRQLRRVLHPAGAGIHSVDLRDMMGMSLNHLRFKEKTWESNYFRKAGFYTNRLRASEFMQLAREAGFEPELDEINRWPALPVPRRKLDPAFQAMPEEDLLIATIRIIMRPAATAPIGGATHITTPFSEAVTA